MILSPQFRYSKLARAMSIILAVTFLFTGCSGGYQRLSQDSTVDPNPREYLDLGDSVRLELRDGTQLAGTVERLRMDSVTVNAEVIPWSEVIVVEKLKESAGVTIVSLAAIGAVVVLVIVAIGLANGGDQGP
jgi:hypothetical protein